MHEARPYAALVLLLLGMLPTGGCGRQRTVAPDDEPSNAPYKGATVLLTDESLDTGGCDTVRFGRLRSGEIALLPLRFVNASAHSLVLRSVDRSCGCTELDFGREPLAPGKARRASLSFDSRGSRGWQFKALDLHFAGHERPHRIFVETEIE